MLNCKEHTLTLGVHAQLYRKYTQIWELILNSSEYTHKLKIIRLKSSDIFSVPLYFKVIFNLKTSVAQSIRRPVHTQQAKVRSQPPELLFSLISLMYNIVF